MPQEKPKLFISYSWTTPEHEEWVLSLATGLRESGVDVVLDKWDLREGQDAHAFMERMVTDPKINKVALVCDHLYAAKADGRSGGVGTETQIISPEVYASQDQTKFVAVLPERGADGKAFLPAYYKSRIYIDLSDPDLYSRNFEQLLRWAFDKPLHVKPELGEMPSFLDDETRIPLPTAATFRRAISAIRDGRATAPGALDDYLQTLSEHMESFRIERGDRDFDEELVENIEAFTPYRGELVEVIAAVSRYGQLDGSWDLVHRFFERVLPLMHRPQDGQSWKTWDFDNFRFIIHELFLHVVATLLRHRAFAGVECLVGKHFFVPEWARGGDNALVSFAHFSQPIGSLDHRNKRLELRRLSLHADILNHHASTAGETFEGIMQADLLLYLRDCLDSIRSDKWQQWWPISLLYAGRHRGAF